MIGSVANWKSRMKAADELQRRIGKLHCQIHNTDNSAVIPSLRRAHSIALEEYTKHMAALAQLAPARIHRLYVICLKQQDSLERRLNSMLEGDVLDRETLIQLEVTYERARALRAAGAELGENQPARPAVKPTVPAAAADIQGKLNLNARG